MVTTPSVATQKQSARVIPRSAHSISKTDISISALKVMNRLHKNQWEAYLVGGSVRDLLLRKTPKDFDVATDAHPNQIRELFRNCHLIGRRFRLAHIQFGREIIEVATFRANIPLEEENEEEDILRARSRQIKSKEGMILQDNVYGDIVQDAWRRDFTINALYYNIADYSIVDFTGGFEDLKNKMIRLIGDPTTRYQEDPVRMLRAIRFATKLDFELDPATEKPIKTLAPLLKKVPSARLFDEIMKLYYTGCAGKTHSKLCQYNLFAQLFPLTSRVLSEERTQRLIEHTLESTDGRINANKPVTPSFFMAALLWHPLLKQVAALEKTGLEPLAALEQAMSQVIAEQNQHIAIPRRFTQVMREIWFLQYRFPRRYGKRPLLLLQHPRFRAAYDFLLIRTLAEEAPMELAEWWTEFQETDSATQHRMLSEANHAHTQQLANAP